MVVFLGVCMPKGGCGPRCSCRDRGNHAFFCEESLRKIDEKDVELFWNGSGHKFYCFKRFITLEQVNTSVETSMVRL